MEYLRLSKASTTEQLANFLLKNFRKYDEIGYTISKSPENDYEPVIESFNITYHDEQTEIAPNAILVTDGNELMIFELNGHDLIQTITIY